MEQRSKIRIKLNDPVLITALKRDGAIFIARFVDLSSESMRIKLDVDLEVGSLLRLELGDDLMMTEVSHCEPDAGEFRAGLFILSCLQKSELNRLRREAVAGPA